MIDTLYLPITNKGKRGRRINDSMKQLSGQAFCTSCQQVRPADQVKVYRATNGRGIGLPRCDICQAKRQEWLRCRK